MMKYFDNDDLVDLLKFAEEKDGSCTTLNLINSRHAFEVPDTPTLCTHVKFLNELEQVTGVTNHQSLFSVEEDVKESTVEDQEDIIRLRFGNL